MANRNSSESFGAGDVGDGSGNLTFSPLSPAVASHTFSAPFLTTWLCNAATVLYLPLYAAGKAMAAAGCCLAKSSSSPGAGGLRLALRGAVQNFRERGFTTCESITVRGYCIRTNFMTTSHGDERKKAVMTGS